MRYYKPESEAEKKTAQIECLKNPKLYEALLSSYGNNVLPTANALATTLFRRYNIAENASQKAAEIFIENLKSLSLLDDENRLLLLDQAENQPNEPQISHIDSPPPNSPSNTNNSQNSFQSSEAFNQKDLSMGIKLKDGRRATLIYPEDIVDGDWDKIVRVINAMKENE